MAKLKNCKTCGASVAKSAKTCPTCGAKLKLKHPILFVIGLFILLTAFMDIIAGDPKDTKTQYAVGEMADINNISVVLVDVYEDEGSAYNEPTDGNIFVLCEFEIANNSEKEIGVSSMLSFAAFCDDYTCNYSLAALLEKGDKNQLDGLIAPGKKLNGIVGYEVPKDWQELEIAFSPENWNGKKATFIATNN